MSQPDRTSSASGFTDMELRAQETLRMLHQQEEASIGFWRARACWFAEEITRRASSETKAPKLDNDGFPIIDMATWDAAVDRCAALAELDAAEYKSGDLMSMAESLHGEAACLALARRIRALKNAAPQETRTQPADCGASTSPAACPAGAAPNVTQGDAKTATPRTDEMLSMMDAGGIETVNGALVLYRAINLCRELERDLAELGRRYDRIVENQRVENYEELLDSRDKWAESARSQCERSWLIEMPAARRGTGYFWKGVDEYQEWGVLDEAVRFTRKADAERVIASLKRRKPYDTLALEACEHIWDDGLPKADRAEVLEALCADERMPGCKAYLDKGLRCSTCPAVPAPSSTRQIEGEAFALPREMIEEIQRTLEFYASDDFYLGPRTGGVVQGCPRGAPLNDMGKQALETVVKLTKMYPLQRVGTPSATGESK